MSGFLGMDTDAARGHADQLVAASGRLGELLDGLDATLGAVDWQGPDADSFRQHWGSTRQTAVPLGDELRAAAQALGAQADEQDQVSSGDDDGGGGFLDWLGDVGSGFLDWLGDVGSTVIDAIGDGLSWIGDRAGEFWNGFVDYLGTAWGNIQELWRSASGLVWNTLEAIVTGDWPRLISTLAGVVDVAADVVNTAFHLLTGYDLHLFDDGTGYADQPVPVADGDGRFGAPANLAEIMDNSVASYGPKDTGEISMSVVGGDPPTGVIVNIPGTEPWSPFAGDNPLDLSGNVAQAGPNGWSAGSQATEDAIRQLYADNNIPPGTPLMLNGHSQGGMVATSLAANPDFMSEFNVTNVMTFGSPVDNDAVPSDVHVINIQHATDLVPRLDAEGQGLQLVPGLDPSGIREGLANHNIGSGNTTTVTLPNRGPIWDLGANHDGGGYVESVSDQLAIPTSQLAELQRDPSLIPFLTSDDTQVQHYTSELHREN